MKDTQCWRMWRKNKNTNVMCFDDITGKELPWHAVRKARELELKYLRDLGVCTRKSMRKKLLKVWSHSSRHEMG